MGRDVTARLQAGRGRWLAVGAIVLSGLVLGLDTTILVTALPTLSAKLGATTDKLQWISAAYTLALAGFMIPAGVLADRLGRRRMLLAALVVFGGSDRNLHADRDEGGSPAERSARRRTRCAGFGPSRSCAGRSGGGRAAPSSVSHASLQEYPPGSRF